jgi:hypothetical protein
MRGAVRTIGVVALLALLGCELEPPPKQAPAAAQPAGSGSGSGSGSGAGSGSGSAMEVSEACLAAASHFAEALIKNANDEPQRHLYEQLRAQTVRRAAEACTAQHWSDAAIKCYGDATTTDQINACQKLLPAPAAPSKG